jgi:bifunctional non-homologous end joining protein LigD
VDKQLDAYKAKRDFSKTREPSGRRRRAKTGNSYVIQKHAARRLHYDFRLELNGVLKSWAVPQGPSLVPGEKRLAVHVEDHPLEYGGFEGVIPKGEYGGGTVMIWDRGSWTPEFDPEFGYRKGHLKFELHGEKLKGMWHLVRMAPKPREKQEAWLLFKSDDEAARRVDAPDILAEMPLSAASGRTMEEIAEGQDRVWSAKQGEITPKAKRRKPAVHAARIAKSKPGSLPAFVEPCLPSTVDKAPSGPDWVHEIKYDGYRVQAHIEKGRAKLLTRAGLDWTEKFGGVGKAAARLPVKSALIDGEIVVETEAGIANFSALQDALSSGTGRLVYYAFDLLHLDGYDLRAASLMARRAALGKLIAAGDTDTCIRFSEHIEGDGDTIFRHACRLGLEGLISKKASAPYRSGRVKTWVKIRCARRGPFVIAGFMPSSIERNAVGALVLGEYVGGRLTPSGHVGTGFSSGTARELFQRLNRLRARTAPLEDNSAEAKSVRWVEPRLVAEIEYRTRTAAGLIRHSAFKGLLEDGNAAQVVRPRADTAASSSVESPPAVRLTNPARLLWPEQGITKQGLADFYTEIADWILPHVVGRALSLVRCPAGVHEACFFQKHKWAGLGSRVRLVAVPGDDEPMLAIDDLAGLLELVQASVLEIHPWGSKADRPELPDRVIIDLDPGDDVPWEQVIEAAVEVKDRIAALGLKSFVKTTGGKGLHVVLPLTPKADWDTVKAFAQSISESMAAERPDRFTANMAKKVRRGRIYVDYLRNGMGATAVAAYSTRARPGAAVSTPLAWDELAPGIRASHFTVENLPQRLAFLDQDPWQGFFQLRQELPISRRPAGAKRTGRKSTLPPGAPEENILRLLPDAVVPPKDELAAYWRKVGKNALKYVGRRPLELVRHVGDTTFYHRGPLPAVPGSVHDLLIGETTGGEGVRPWVDSVEGLLDLVEIGVVEIHPWGATVDDIERPDTLVFDLDPGEGIEWDFVVETAFRLRDLLADDGLASWPKLTGGKSLHVMVPVEPDLNWSEALEYSKGIADRTEALAPDRTITSAQRTGRRGRLFVNWLRNGCGCMAIGAYSPRARPGFPVAAPVSWVSLEEGMGPDTYSIRKPPRLRQRR